MLSTLKSLYHAYLAPPSVSDADLSVAKTRVEDLIKSSSVVVFSKSYCPYCSSSKSTLTQLGQKDKMVVLELDHDPAGPAIQSYLAKRAGFGKVTVPQIYLKQELIGGNSDLESLKNKGGLGKYLD